MSKHTGVMVRAFDGSLAEAEGLLTVERATFHESPYSAAQVRAMLTDGPQRAWVALGGGKVVGFAIAFPTGGLRGPCWEIDLLAVQPAWRGRGLATRLVRAAGAGGVGVAHRTRAVIATDNGASLRAFARAGFRAAAESCKLLIHRTEDPLPHAHPAPGVTIRAAADVAEAADWLADPSLAPQTLPGYPGLTLLLAERDSQPAGYAELIEVQTLLYRGVWIESLVAATRQVRAALIHHAVRRARAAGLNEVGTMTPESNRPLQKALLAGGFRSLGDFWWVTARLPLPGLATLLAGRRRGG